MTHTQNDVQNLHVNNSWIKSLGAWICNHSNIPHFTIREITKAVIIEITATQHTKSTIRIIRVLVIFLQTSMHNKGASYIGCQLLILTDLYSILSYKG